MPHPAWRKPLVGDASQKRLRGVRFREASLIAFGVLILTVHLAAAADDADAAYAEHILRDEGVPSDAPGVAAYLRAHTLSEEELDRLERAVRLLGDDEYRERESACKRLIEAGLAALPFLRPAIHDDDPEIVRRAKRCIAAIRRKQPSPVIAAAAQIIKYRRPKDGAAVLLAYLPCIDEQATIETWFDALAVVGWQDDRPDPALLAALTDKRAIRRAAAAYVLGRAPSADARRLVHPLLNDRDARVRYQAAAGLAGFGNKDAIPALIALLTSGPLPVASQAEELLSYIAEGMGPEIGLSQNSRSRGLRRLAWDKWWREHASEVDLERLRREEPPRGRTVVCEYDGGGSGRVWEWDRSGKMRWEITQLKGPNDIQFLSGGRVLIAERNADRVTERDHSGKILWQHRTSLHPISCQRLPNGNTLIVTFSQLYEVTIDQKIIFSYTHDEGFRHAVQRPDGRIVCITGRQGRIIELDSARKEARNIQLAKYANGAAYWASVEPLANGRYLVALGGANRVVEVDASGKIQWEAVAKTPVFATRLRNGHTLISCFEERCVLELDRRGTLVSKQRLRGRPFAVRRY